MLDVWLGSVTRDAFLRTYLRRRALAQPATTRGAVPLLDWAVTAALLAADGTGPDVLTVARGRLFSGPAPRTPVAMHALVRAGVGFCVRHAERADAGLRRLADGFDVALGVAQIQVFATPGGTYGFGWHYDDEDVFIAQTAGAKDYYFRPNTVAADRTADATSFARYPDETSPLHTAHLIAGDFLYLPARWWHMALCRADALSISVGVVPRDAVLRAAAASRVRPDAAPDAGPAGVACPAGPAPPR